MPRALASVEPEMRAVVERLAGITRGAGIVMAAQEIAADPSGALRTILSLLKLLVFGRAQQTIDEVASKAPRLDCKSGCAYCCYQNVEVTIPEAILVAAHLTAGDPRRERVLETAQAVAGLGDEERRRTGRPCPLLVDNKCSVYHDRPLMCRSILAVDAERCRAAHESAVSGGPEVAVEYFAHAQYYVLGDQAGLRGILKDMGVQYDLVDLTQAVAAILRDPDLIDRWLARERVFGPDMIRA